MALPLPRFLETFETRREHARKLERVVRDAGVDLRELKIVCDPSDGKTLRGIPCLAYGVGGAIAGTRPESICWRL